ncbi:protein DYAD-like [Hibiscus syriacus]|nr:protein DYAD-like [Hibiscus syriacus]
MTVERYNLAEESMLEIMKAEGAVYEHPISRPALRMAARKLIGDTGLLDHLLKHIDGKVAPGGTDRFRRCYNTSGVMEYWLESADLANKRKEAGISQFWQKPDEAPFHASTSAIELKLLKDEMGKMKRDLQELVSKQQEPDQANSIEEMQKDMVKWKAKTDGRLMEFMSSLNGMQIMCKELMTWKARVEQQMLEISNSLSSLQESKQCNLFSPATSERWEDWFKSTNLDNFQGGNLGPWLDNPELINFAQDVVQDSGLTPLAWQQPGHSPFEGLVCAQDLDMINEEMDKIMSTVQELGAPRRQGEDQSNVTPDSSVTSNSKTDHDSLLLLVQEMLKDLMKWKTKTKQQLADISSMVSVLLKSRQ